MRYKIGIFGSAEGSDEIIIQKAVNLGQTLSNYPVELITGACSGLPYQVAFEAAKNGVPVFGYSPMLNIKGQKQFTPTDDLSIYKKVFFTPKTFDFCNNSLVCKKYRNVVSTANCDAGIIISGRWGTMNEFTNLYDMGKIIGILTGTGGIADEIEKLNSKIIKKSKAKIIFNNSPMKLVNDIINELNKQT